MKVVVFGAGGIVGQEMLLRKPENVDAIFTRRKKSGPFTAFDVDDGDRLDIFLAAHSPDVIVNLAGENRVDVVEGNPSRYRQVNELLPLELARWCAKNDCHLIQCSTQGVFSGENAPYKPTDVPHPITWYGKQKAVAETHVRDVLGNDGVTVARLTFVIGSRPFNLGRPNPLELMFAEGEQVQVSDRWFSPLWSVDAAKLLWSAVENRPGGFHHLGEPRRVSRYDLACHSAWETNRMVKVHKVSHGYFKGIAPRPKDTTWSRAAYLTHIEQAVLESYSDWRDRMDRRLDARATEISLFLGTSFEEVKDRLTQGFGHNHVAVARDFGDVDPTDEEALLNWYRQTDSYIYELSAYHLDPGFNYSGMCEGIVTHLKNAGLNNVLALGDGIGDLTLSLKEAGLNPTYHDLEGSKTSDYAKYRFDLHFDGDVATRTTTGWEPTFGGSFDAVVALDFFEHVVNVEDWARAVHATLPIGGSFLAQNAFGIGDAEHGNSIPMHLAINNKYEKEWDPMMERIGFRRHGGWYIRES